MKYKLKNGVEVDLHDEDMKAISELYNKDKEFDSEKLLKYFHDMWNKSKLNLEVISEESDLDTEKQLKETYCHVMKYGSAYDIADFTVELMEYMISKMIIKSME